MKTLKINRRNFMRVTATGAAGATLAEPAPAAPRGGIVIEHPVDGAVLNRRHGTKTPEGLRIHVSGRAPADRSVRVNGEPARREGERFISETVLRRRENEILAEMEGSDRARARVAWDRYSRPRYRVAIDDNSFFLRDIAQNGYRSLFDCFYLKMLRGLHEKYGAKFALNIYYTTGEDFNLTQFPDRYRAEWKDHAGWLKLAFHAHADKPDRPYQDAPPEKLARDFDRVVEQILRFAGEDTYSPTTIVHWGMVRPEAYKTLYRRGVRALSGYFRRNPAGQWDVNYRLDDVRSEYLSRHDAWKDYDSGIVFSKIDIVINSTPLDRIAPTLDLLKKNPDTAEILDLMTHEQYFWPFYRRHLPDHPARLEAAVRWAAENNYHPVFLHEGFLGSPKTRANKE